MKIFKFRPLAIQDDFNRAKQIIETGNFWCSKFSELNDPMEGAFHASTIKKVNEAFRQKKRYGICSFSGQDALKNPILWGYYANGFRGIAIEVECENNEVEKITYEKNIKTLEDEGGLVDAKDILTTKLEPWVSEDEYRFLVESQNNFHKIGEITAVYFGDPYNRAVNKDEIYHKSKLLNNYKDLKEKLIKVIDSKKIRYKDVIIKGISVKVIE